MERYARGFVRSSLVWLGLGVTIGVGMVFFPMQAAVYRPAHMHANLLGFVSMMIFGVAYHVLPRFTGNPLYSRRLAELHLIVANVGLTLMVGGWMSRAWLSYAAYPLRAGAALSAIGAALFIFDIWRTLDTGASHSIPKQERRT